LREGRGKNVHVVTTSGEGPSSLKNRCTWGKKKKISKGGGGGSYNTSAKRSSSAPHSSMQEGEGKNTRRKEGSLLEHGVGEALFRKSLYCRNMVKGKGSLGFGGGGKKVPLLNERTHNHFGRKKKERNGWSSSPSQ